MDRDDDKATTNVYTATQHTGTWSLEMVSTCLYARQRYNLVTMQLMQSQVGRWHLSPVFRARRAPGVITVPGEQAQVNPMLSFHTVSTCAL